MVAILVASACLGVVALETCPQALAQPASGSPCAAWDISGTWMTVQSNTYHVTWQFAQSGTTVAGTGTMPEADAQRGGYTGTQGKIVKGSINGDRLEVIVQWPTKTDGSTVQGEYVGTIEQANGSDRGSVSNGEGWNVANPSLRATWTGEGSATCNGGWPPLPDALMPLNSVSNGCGGGPASDEAKYGDDSEYANTEIPFDNLTRWNTSPKYHVNFREACKQHDAGYSHAKVVDPLNGNKVTDYFGWTKAQIDDKFLADMIKICDQQIPASATVALNNCKHNGGFHLVAGARTRYNLVAATTYTQKIGIGFYQEAPGLGGSWSIPGLNTGAWSISQNQRLVTATWQDDSGSNPLTGAFRGTLISHDATSTVQGFYRITKNGTTTAAKPMTLTWDTKTPNELRSSAGYTLTR